MKRVILAAAVSALAFAAGPAMAQDDCRTFVGTIRDFSSSHPNFESTIGGLETGIVLPDLGVDGTPDFNPLTTAVGVTNATDFFDWYHDTAANLSDAFNFTLTETSPGVFSYAAPDFFPIDDALLGNEGNSHNYHFTVQASMPFHYEPGQFLNVTADDDLWVFIDGVLAIDLGGTHPAVSGSVDLDALGLNAGETYMIDLFYAERHTTEAKLFVETNVKCPCVPEPSTFALGGLAMFGAGLCRWLRRS